MKASKDLAVVVYGLAGGIGFVWLFGFAVGYPNPLVAWLLAGAWVGCLWLGSKIQKSSR